MCLVVAVVVALSASPLVAARRVLAAATVVCTEAGVQIRGAPVHVAALLAS
jgi:hypothetical protein